MTQNICNILEEHNVILTKETMEKMEKTIVAILDDERKEVAVEKIKIEENVVKKIGEYQNDQRKEGAVFTKAQKCLKKCRNMTCAEPGLHRCSRCRCVSYCTEACSRAGWGDHQEV